MHFRKQFVVVNVTEIEEGPARKKIKETVFIDYQKKLFSVITKKNSFQ